MNCLYKISVTQPLAAVKCGMEQQPSFQLASEQKAGTQAGFLFSPS
jgi:hypothetical protein